MRRRHQHGRGAHAGTNGWERVCLVSTLRAPWRRRRRGRALLALSLMLANTAMVRASHADAAQKTLDARKNRRRVIHSLSLPYAASPESARLAPPPGAPGAASSARARFGDGRPPPAGRACSTQVSAWPCIRARAASARTLTIVFGSLLAGAGRTIGAACQAGVRDVTQKVVQKQITCGAANDGAAGLRSAVLTRACSRMSC